MCQIDAKGWSWREGRGHSTGLWNVTGGMPSDTVPKSSVTRQVLPRLLPVLLQHACAGMREHKGLVGTAHTCTHTHTRVHTVPFLKVPRPLPVSLVCNTMMVTTGDRLTISGQRT